MTVWLLYMILRGSDNSVLVGAFDDKFNCRYAMEQKPVSAKKYCVSVSAEAFKRSRQLIR